LTKSSAAAAVNINASADAAFPQPSPFSVLSLPSGGFWAGGRLCSALLRVVARNRGSNLPGAVALKLDPDFLKHIKGVDPEKTVFITGTNGKSTANNMVVHAFQADGRSVCSNLEGANMKSGAATALLKNTSPGGRFKKEYLILEVDERSLASISEDLKPGHLCVTNVQKDQVQRNGDPDYIYRKIKSVISKTEGLKLYVNNEEPRGKSLGEGVHAVSFGVAQNAHGFDPDPVWEVTMPCPLCREALSFAWYNLAGVGGFRCPACGFASGGPADYSISEVDYESGSFRAEGEVYRLSYPAEFFLYDYALCLCLCLEFGIKADVLRKAFDTFENIGGRTETFTYAGKEIKYMRIKQENPETLQSALDTIAIDKSKKIFVLGPAVVDDMVPHYSNTFYTFDCCFDTLIKSGVERVICFGDTIATDTANRLRYAGVPDGDIDILNTDDDDKILDAIAACDTNNVYLITWIKKYEKLKERAG